MKLALLIMVYLFFYVPNAFGVAGDDWDIDQAVLTLKAKGFSPWDFITLRGSEDGQVYTRSESLICKFVPFGARPWQHYDHDLVCVELDSDSDSIDTQFHESTTNLRTRVRLRESGCNPMIRICE